MFSSPISNYAYVHLCPVFRTELTVPGSLGHLPRDEATAGEKFSRFFWLIISWFSMFGAQTRSF